MNLLTLPFKLPLLPLQGFLQLGEILHDEADRQLHDPAVLRRQLEEAEQAHASGEMSEEDVARLQGQAVGRLVSAPAKPSAEARRANRS
jgi:hypothetical protein